MKKTLLSSLLLLAISAQAETVFHRDNGAEPKSLDPQIASEDAGGAILVDLFEGLTRPTIDGKTEAGGAESWDISEDGKTYTFHLRDNKWSDGEPVKAEDYVYAWQRAVDPNVSGEYAFILYPVKNAEEISSGKITDLSQLGIKALDDKTVQVELNNPTPYFLQLLTHYTAKPVPKHVVEKYGREWTRPENIVSNGAYHLTEWQPQAKIIAEKSDTYWDKDNVSIDKVIFYPIEDQSASLSRYRAGEIDYVKSVPIEMLDWAKKEVPDELKISPALSIYYYGFNLTKEPFKDNLALRKALTIAVDRQAMVDHITKAGQTPAYGFVPPKTDHTIPYMPDYAKLSRPEQIKLAQELYKEAGYSKENPVHVKITYNTSEGHKKIAVATAAMWKQVLGAEVELENLEWKVLLSKLNQDQIPLYRSAWNGDYNDPYTFLELFHSGSGQNHARFKSDEYDGLLQKASATADLEERAKILQQAEKVLIENYPIIPFYHYVKVKLLKPYVKGYKPNIMDDMPTQYLRIEK